MQIFNSFPTSLKTSRLSLFPLLFFILISTGCVVKDMGNTVKHSIQGEHYLSTDNYSAGVKNFKQAVNDNPDNVSANYYYGRFLLAEKHYKKASRYLQKASSLDPDNPDYHFWVGVAYESLGKKSLEKKSYLKALSIKKDHLQSLIYLGHNQFEAKKYSKALGYYQKALKIWPACPSALYNRALIATKLGRKPEALVGWRDYLSYYPSGAMARQAVDHLNNLGDFSFRNYTLKTRAVTLEKIYFKPFSAQIDKGSAPSLDLIGTIYSNMKKGKLQVVVCQLKNKELAKQRALSIKNFLLKNYPKIKSKDIGISWFDSAEVLKVIRGKRRINESVSFFITN